MIAEPNHRLPADQETPVRTEVITIDLDDRKEPGVRTGEVVRKPSAMPLTYTKRSAAVSGNEKALNVRRPRYWLIVQQRTSRIDVFTLDLAGGGKAFAVFSFEEEAGLFLHCELSGTNWQVRETMAGELISVLNGPCADVSKVALDPLPRNVGKEMTGLVSLRREDFVQFVAGG